MDIFGKKKKAVVKKEVLPQANVLPQQPGPDIAAFMYRIEQKLAFLERKMDVLISQGPARQHAAPSAQHPRSQENRHGQAQHHSRPFEVRQHVAPVAPPAPQSRPSEVPPEQAAPQVSAERPSQGHGRVRRERVLFKTVCADCQKDCEIPFKPTGERPVYCKECFSQRKASRSVKAPAVLPIPEDTAVTTPEAVLEEAPAPMQVSGERKVTVTKKGVGRVTVSEIAPSGAREASPRAKPQRPAPAKRSRR